MNTLLNQIHSTVYLPYGLLLSNFQNEEESQEYDACQFRLNELLIINRSAKVTPKKVGQFVTFWKRSKNGPIAPYHETDTFDFFTVNVQTATQFGQFVFPKSILIQKGILSTDRKEGKRAFRVYPSWDIAQNKQAQQSQKWQLDYFYEINTNIDRKKVLKLYQTTSI